HSKDDEAASIALDGEGGLSILGKNGLSNGSTEYMLVRYAKKQLTIPPGDGAASPALAFTEQRGQLTDTSGTSVEGVRFYSTGSYPPLYVQNDTLSFVTASVDTSSATPDTLHRVDITFFDSKTSLMSAAGLDKLDNYRNYYLGHIPEGRARVGQYGRVAVTDLYDGINLQMFADESGIVYYFVIQPGGDPNDLKLDFHGQDSLYLKARNLFVGTSLGDFNLPAPKAFQIDSLGQEVSTAWKPEYSIAGSRVSFSSTGSYDSTKVLVVELRRPEVTSVNSEDDWITYFGGTSSNDAVLCNDINFSNEYFIGGRTSSLSFPEVTGIMTFGENLSMTNAYVAKFNEDLSIKYLTILGGGENDWANDLKEVNGNVYTVGFTRSDDFPTDSGAPSNVGHGFIASFDSFTGELEKTTILGEGSELNCLDVNSQAGFTGSNLGLFVGGEVENSTFVVQSSSLWDFHDSSFNGGTSDGLIARYSFDLEEEWSSFFGGNGLDRVLDLEVSSADGKIFIAGITTTESYSSIECDMPNDSGFPSCNPAGSSQYVFGNTNGTTFNSDVFLAEFSSQGELSWSTFFGGQNYDAITTSSSISIHENKLSVIGYSASLNTMPANTGGGFQLSGISEGHFLAEFEDRALSWKTSIGCNEAGFNRFLYTGNAGYDGNGVLYFSGNTHCTTGADSGDYCNVPEISQFPLCPGNFNGFFESDNFGFLELFVGAVDANKNLVYSTFLGGGNQDFVNCQTVKNGSLYLGGETTSEIDFPLSFPLGAYEQSDLYGFRDGTIMKLNSQGIVQVNNFQKSEKNSITVYPNPSSGTTIIVEFDLMSFTGNHFPFRLFSAEGKLMQSSPVGVQVGTYKVDVSNFPPGVYYIVSRVGSARFIKINRSF
ncbi:MAG: T9SS type A sorting domain-containing protein, partial [bacterium]|nr:T9SS type A sorting domain-containing protein [bacterium]